MREAVPEARAEVHQKSVGQLTPHQRTLYEIVHEHESLAPGTLYDRYAERVAEPKTNRTVRNHLSKLAHYDLIVAEGENRGRTYRIAR